MFLILIFASWILLSSRAPLFELFKQELDAALAINNHTTTMESINSLLAKLIEERAIAEHSDDSSDESNDYDAKNIIAPNFVEKNKSFSTTKSDNERKHLSEIGQPSILLQPPAISRFVSVSSMASVADSTFSKVSSVHDSYNSNLLNKPNSTFLHRGHTRNLTELPSLPSRLPTLNVASIPLLRIASSSEKPKLHYNDQSQRSTYSNLGTVNGMRRQFTFTAGALNGEQANALKKQVTIRNSNLHSLPSEVTNNKLSKLNAIGVSRAAPPSVMAGFLSRAEDLRQSTNLLHQQKHNKDDDSDSENEHVNKSKFSKLDLETPSSFLVDSPNPQKFGSPPPKMRISSMSLSKAFGNDVSSKYQADLHYDNNELNNDNNDYYIGKKQKHINSSNQTLHFDLPNRISSPSQSQINLSSPPVMNRTSIFNSKDIIPEVENENDEVTVRLKSTGNKGI